MAKAGVGQQWCCRHASVRPASLLVAVLVGALSGAVPVRGDLIQNGSFENQGGTFVPNQYGDMELSPNSPSSTAIPGWTLTSSGGALVWIDNANIWGITASNGVKSLDLTAYAGVPPYAGMQQTQAIATTQDPGIRPRQLRRGLQRPRLSG